MVGDTSGYYQRMLVVLLQVWGVLFAFRLKSLKPE